MVSAARRQGKQLEVWAWARCLSWAGGLGLLRARCKGHSATALVLPMSSSSLHQGPLCPELWPCPAQLWEALCRAWGHLLLCQLGDPA